MTFVNDNAAKRRAVRVWLVWSGAMLELDRDFEDQAAMRLGGRICALTPAHAIKGRTLMVRLWSALQDLPPEARLRSS